MVMIVPKNPCKMQHEKANISKLKLPFHELNGNHNFAFFPPAICVETPVQLTSKDSVSIQLESILAEFQMRGQFYVTRFSDMRLAGLKLHAYNIAYFLRHHHL